MIYLKLLAVMVLIAVFAVRVFFMEPESINGVEYSAGYSDFDAEIWK